MTDIEELGPVIYDSNIRHGLYMQILTLNIKELTRPVLQFETIEFTDHHLMILGKTI